MNSSVWLDLEMPAVVDHVHQGGERQDGALPASRAFHFVESLMTSVVSLESRGVELLALV